MPRLQELGHTKNLCGRIIKLPKDRPPKVLKLWRPTRGLISQLGQKIGGLNPRDQGSNYHQKPGTGAGKNLDTQIKITPKRHVFIH